MTSKTSAVDRVAESPTEGREVVHAFRWRWAACAVALAIPGLALAILPNDPAKRILLVNPGETKELSSNVASVDDGSWYDIQGRLIVKKGGVIEGKNSTNWLHGVSVAQPASAVSEEEGKLNSHYGSVLACDGYLAQPALDYTLRGENDWPYAIDILATAKPVDAAGNVLATNEIMRIHPNSGVVRLNMYQIRNYSTIPALIDVVAEGWESELGGFVLRNNRNHHSKVPGGEIILRSSLATNGNGKKFPIVYFFEGSTCSAVTFPFPHADEQGKLTIDGPGGLLVRNRSTAHFGTVTFKKAYDSGNIAWRTTGECQFCNAILRPEVDDSFPYADDRVITVGVSRDTGTDWSSVSNWAEKNGCLDVNGKTVKVGKLYTENGAVVTNFTATTGTLVFGDNNLESGFRGVATAGVVLRKTGAGIMKFGDSQIDALEVTADSTGLLTSDGASAVVRVRSFTVGGVEQPAGVYSCATLPKTITGGLLVEVGEAEPIYWVGGASGDWQTAANWSSQTVPRSGDYVIFTNVVTSLTSQDNAEIDISPKGIVFDCRAGSGTESSGVQVDLSFAGSGCIYKAGSYVLRFGKPQKHSGGIVINAGLVFGNSNDSNIGKHGWGTGCITIDRRSGADPYLFVSGSGHALSNEIKILGSFTGMKKQSLAFDTNGGELLGKITAEDDFTIKSGYVTSYTRIYCDIDAPGKTVYVMDPGYGSRIRFTGNINCSIDTVTAGVDTEAGGYSRALDVVFSGTNLCEDVNLVLRDFTNEFSRAAVWSGTNIVLKLRTKNGQPVTDRDGRLHTTALVLKGDQNLSPNSTLNIDPNCWLVIDADVKVKVKECFVDGVALKPGTYSASRCPDLIDGKGVLKVGNAGLAIIVR